MHIIGIIGGIAPPSTVDYYRLLVEGWQRRRPDGSQPLIVINSVELKKGLELVGAASRGEREPPSACRPSTPRRSTWTRCWTVPSAEGIMKQWIQWGRMRARFAVVLAVLALGADVVEAQRVGGRPRIGSRPRPAPLPPQPAALKRELRYVQLPLAFESYPFTSFVTSSVGLGPGSSTSWSSLGFGSRVSLRLTPLFMATFDVTSSVLGGPIASGSAELGLRAQRGGWDQRVRPFADIRYGYVRTANSSFGTYDDPFLGGSFVNGFQYSDGWGGVAGGGLSIGLGTRWFMTTGVHATRADMRSYQVTGSTPPGDGRYRLDAVRVLVGFTYNPVRAIASLSQPAR